MKLFTCLFQKPLIQFCRMAASKQKYSELQKIFYQTKLSIVLISLVSTSSSTMTSFGLHVGNTNSCLAVHKDYSANVVANDAGSRVTPTSVGFTDDGEVLTGLSAKQFLARFPKSGIRAGNKAAVGETVVHCYLLNLTPAFESLVQLTLVFPGVTGIADASEKLAQNFHVTSMGPKLISTDAGIYYEIDKQKKVRRIGD